MLKKLSTAEISLVIKDAIVETLDDHKAQEITTINLAGKTELADFMVIASGTSTRHVAALARHIGKRLDDLSLTEYGLEGEEDPHWMILDNPFVIVHLFHPEYRKLYQLEKMWDADDLFAEAEEVEADAVS